MHNEQRTRLNQARLAVTQQRDIASAAGWAPAVLGLFVICCESTRVMGADHTLVWLSRICSPLMHVASSNHVASPHIVELNHVLRKSGHFFGYGMLGLVFMQGWQSLLLARLHQTWTRLRLLAGAVAVPSVALIASMDELHQSWLPNRTACTSDVLLDTSGAVLLITFVSLLFLLRRRRMLMQLTERRAVRQWKQAVQRRSVAAAA